jgi:hypothetical protein
MKSIIKCLTVLAALLLLLAGCEWDGPTAAYNQPQPDYPNAVITQIEPEVAVAGANYITIHGDNFAENLTDNLVFFDNAQVDLIEGSTTSLTVRRPVSAGDSITVKVVAYGTLVVAKFGPYQIEPVREYYGNFIENKQHETISVDRNENVYVIQRSPADVHKITPDGNRTIIGTAAVIPTHALIAPNGKLTYFKDRRIRQIDLTTGVNDTLIDVTKSVTFGDYDENGNLFAGGRRTDIIIVKPDITSSAAGLYAGDEIFCIRVFQGNLYLLADIARPDDNTPALGIFRHSILDAEGHLGPREVVLDWAETGEYAESEPLSFTFSAEGKLFVAADHANPLLMIDLTDGSQDIMYKDILTGVIAGMEWGTGNYLYYIKDTYTPEGGEPDNIFDCVRVDMGESGAPYYGRM